MLVEGRLAATSWVGGKRGNDFRVLTVMGGGSRGRVSFDEGVRPREIAQYGPSERKVCCNSTYYI